MRHRIKRCPICKRLFEPETAWQKYDQLRCGNTARQRRKNAKAKKEARG